MPFLTDEQILQKVLNTDEDRLKVEVNATVTAGAVEVAIDQTTDSIKVGDGTDIMLVNPDGSINVNLSGLSFAGTVKSVFASVSSVPSSTSTTVLSYTVPLGKTDYLERIEISGTNIATYTVLLNAVLIAKKRTNFGAELNVDFTFLSPLNKGLALVASDNLQVQVIHERPTTGDFESRIQYTEI